MWISTATFWALVLGVVVAVSLSALSFSMTRARHRHRPLETRLNALEADYLECLNRLEKVITQVKKLYGREAVRKHRAQQPNGEETDEEWKARMEREWALNKTMRT